MRFVSPRLLHAALAGCCLTAASARLEAQAASSTEGVATAQALADSVRVRFARGDTTRFARIFPFARGVALLTDAVRNAHPAVAEVARVTGATADSATLLLTGFVRFRSTGDETLAAADFSGLYQAGRGRDGLWRLVHALPMAKQTRILAHRLHVVLRPGLGLDVTDSLDLEVESSHGALFHLNHAAMLDTVRVAGRDAHHLFGGGVLWLDAPADQDTPVVLNYRLDIAQDSSAPVNSARFLPDFGHVRGQYMWHPIVWFDDAAAVHINVRAPSGVRVATDLPQTDTILHGTRIVTAAAAVPAGALSLFYDRDWVPSERRVGNYRFTVFATPGFRPPADTLAAAFQRIVRVYSARFGPPQADYLAVVQQRARPGEGWLFRSNNVIAASLNGWLLMFSEPQPGTPFGHEIAHGWTHPAGSARLFLSEGWATWAASLILRDVYGADVEQKYWDAQRHEYLTGDYEGKASLAGDALNSGVSYGKGAWVLKMLEEEIGQAAFDGGMRAWMAIPADRQPDYIAFLDRMSSAAGRDLRDFMTPWVEAKVIPQLTASIEASRLVLTQRQDGPVFQLHVNVDLITASGSVRVTVPLAARTSSFPLPPSVSSPVTRIVIDPARKLLLH